MTEAEQARLRELAVDIDVRLTDVWSTICEAEHLLGPLLEDDDVRDVFAALLRISYGRGYLDALYEDAEGRRAELCVTHGYRQP